MNASEPKFVEFTDGFDPNEVNPADCGLTLNAHYKMVRRPSGEISIVNRVHRIPNPMLIIYKRQPPLES